MGLCPHCLLKVTVKHLASDDHPALNTSTLAGRCPTVEQLNQQIPRLKFIDLLGRGGSGWTFRATQESLSRQVAVKILPRRETSLENSIARFRQEAESLAKLNHPGIVTVHDFGVADEYLFLIMEYVAGPTLRQRLSAGAIGVEVALDIVRQICNAVQCAHDAGILHRDIKPENILFTSNDADAKVKVADFGIAQMLNDESNYQLTKTGMIVGTPFYMAPEQNEINGGVEHRSDVYSIGVVLYEMLTRRLPLGRFAVPSAVCRCSPAVDRAVFAALENRPTDRIRSPQSLIQMLEAPSKDNRSKANRLRTIAQGVSVVVALGMLLAAIGWLVGIPHVVERSNKHVQSPSASPVDSDGAKLVKEIPSKTEDEENPFEKYLLPEKSTNASSANIKPSMEK